KSPTGEVLHVEIAVHLSVGVAGVSGDRLYRRPSRPRRDPLDNYLAFVRLSVVTSTRRGCAPPGGHHEHCRQKFSNALTAHTCEPFRRPKDRALAPRRRNSLNLLRRPNR